MFVRSRSKRPKLPLHHLSSSSSALVPLWNRHRLQNFAVIEELIGLAIYWKSDTTDSFFCYLMGNAQSLELRQIPVRTGSLLGLSSGLIKHAQLSCVAVSTVTLVLCLKFSLGLSLSLQIFWAVFRFTRF